jgi:hypothetical protein
MNYVGGRAVRTEANPGMLSPLQPIAEPTINLHTTKKDLNGTGLNEAHLKDEANRRRRVKRLMRERHGVGRKPQS